MCPLEEIESTILVGYCQAHQEVLLVRNIVEVWFQVPTSMFGTLFIPN